MPSALPLTIRLVRIEAVAGPVPPIFTEEDFAIDFDQEFKRLVEQTRDFTAQQAMDQVYRRPPLGLTPRPPLALPWRLNAHQIRWASPRSTQPTRLLSRGGKGADCQHLVSA